MLGLAKDFFWPLPGYAAAKTVKSDDVKPAISIAIAPKNRPVKYEPALILFIASLEMPMP